MKDFWGVVILLLTNSSALDDKPFSQYKPGPDIENEKVQSWMKEKVVVKVMKWRECQAHKSLTTSSTNSKRQSATEPGCFLRWLLTSSLRFSHIKILLFSWFVRQGCFLSFSSNVCFLQWVSRMLCATVAHSISQLAPSAGSALLDTLQLTQSAMAFLTSVLFNRKKKGIYTNFSWLKHISCFAQFFYRIGLTFNSWMN